MQQVCAQLFFSHRKWGAVFYKIKKSLENFRLQGIFYVREKIRTPDTLVRSQVLYPAELHTHNKCSLGTFIILLQFPAFVKRFFEKNLGNVVKKRS